MIAACLAWGWLGLAEAPLGRADGPPPFAGAHVALGLRGAAAASSATAAGAAGDNAPVPRSALQLEPWLAGRARLAWPPSTTGSLVLARRALRLHLAGSGASRLPRWQLGVGGRRAPTGAGTLAARLGVGLGPARRWQLRLDLSRRTPRPGARLRPRGGPDARLAAALQLQVLPARRAPAWGLALRWPPAAAPPQLAAWGGGAWHALGVTARLQAVSWPARLPLRLKDVRLALGLGFWPRWPRWTGGALQLRAGPRHLALGLRLAATPGRWRLAGQGGLQVVAQSSTGPRRGVRQSAMTPAGPLGRRPGAAARRPWLQLDACAARRACVALRAAWTPQRVALRGRLGLPLAGRWQLQLGGGVGPSSVQLTVAWSPQSW